MSTTLAAQRSKIEIRTTKAQKQVIEQAAHAEGVNVTAFIFSRVLPEAHRVLGERSLFVLNQPSWDKLAKILNRPAQPNSKLKELAQTPSVLEQRRRPHGRIRKS
jgi:uncharacterized protein (DUF1778 family)